MKRYIVYIHICGILFNNENFSCCDNSRNTVLNKSTDIKDSNVQDPEVLKLKLEDKIGKCFQTEKLRDDDNNFINGCKGLIAEYCMKKNIDLDKSKISFTSVTNTKFECKRFQIKNDKKTYYFFIKRDSKRNVQYIDILKKIDLCTLDYICNEGFLLTDALDISGMKDYDDFMICKKNNFDKSILDKADKITNFKEFCFFCALLELVDCHPFFRLDNCYVSDNKIRLLDVNRSGALSFNTPDYNSFGDHTGDIYSYFYSPLLEGSRVPYGSLSYTKYICNKDDVDTFLSSLIFIFQMPFFNVFFKANSSCANSNEVLEFFETRGFGKDLEKLIPVENPIHLSAKQWAKILQIKEEDVKSIELIRTELRRMYSKDCDKFLRDLCEKIWNIECGDQWEEIKHKNYNNQPEEFVSRVEGNIEKCKAILNTMTKYFDCQIWCKKAKFNSIMDVNNLTEAEKENIINKTIIIIDYLIDGLKNISSKHYTFKFAVTDIEHRLKLVQEANIFPFLFENKQVITALEKLNDEHKSINA